MFVLYYYDRYTYSHIAIYQPTLFTMVYDDMHYISCLFEY